MSSHRAAALVAAVAAAAILYSRPSVVPDVVPSACGDGGAQFWEDVIEPTLYTAFKHEVIDTQPLWSEADGATGFWLDIGPDRIDQPVPRCAVEEVLLRLHALAKAACGTRADTIVGAEWWVQRRGGDNATLAFHYDKGGTI
jgi:hypothetical protein